VRHWYIANNTTTELMHGELHTAYECSFGDNDV